VREETKLPGKRNSEEKMANSQVQFPSTILGNRNEKLENPVDNDASCKDCKAIVKLEVPSRVDFGDKITIQWTHSGTPNANDWIAMYPIGKSGGDYYTYQWVTPGPQHEPLHFDAPYSAASNFYFCYMANRSYTVLAESAVVSIGPDYSIQLVRCLENKQQSISATQGNLYSVTLQVSQNSGKQQPNLWLGLYATTDAHIKNFLSYQYCSVDKELTFSIPKSGLWVFKLFPFKSYEPILSFPYFIEGEDKASLSLVGNQFVIEYHIKTLSLDQQPWIGIYDISEGRANHWKRYKYVDNYTGAMTIAANLPNGQYEARILDYVNSAVVAKSGVVKLDYNL
jgi:hypothetical protein